MSYTETIYPRGPPRKQPAALLMLALRDMCHMGLYIAIPRPKGVMKKPYNHC